jgi:hypothetical protein
MKFRSYQKEIHNSTAQVLDLFNNIIIDRRNSNEDVSKEVSVPCFYGQRSRVLKSLEDKNKTIKLPLTCLTVGGIQRDASRAIDIHKDLVSQNDHGSKNHLEMQPVPVNITYDLECVSKYQQDLDQIISNFVVFFNPSVYITIPHPHKTDKRLKYPVTWNGSVTYDPNPTIPESTDARCTAKTSFTVKTWFFTGLEANTDMLKRIHSINFTPTMYEEDGVAALQHWYAVPPDMTFEEYEGNIVLGLIKPEFIDKMTLVVGTSGLWCVAKQGMTVNIPPDILAQLEEQNAEFIVTNEYNLLITAPEEGNP